MASFHAVLGGRTYLFEILVAHALLTARCGRGRSLALLTPASRALGFLLDGLGLRAGSTLSLEHLVPQTVC